MSSNDPADRPDDPTGEHEPAPRAKAQEHEHDHEHDEDRGRARDRAREPEPEDEDRKGRFSRLTRLLMDRGEDARYVLGTVLDSSDRAKTEMVRMVAREVRNYLEALKLTDDLRDFATHHSLEVKASFRLKPLGPEPEEPAEPEEEPPAAPRKRKGD
jgi:hypothetical protein